MIDNGSCGTAAGTLTERTWQPLSPFAWGLPQLSPGCLKMDARSQHVYSWPGCLLGVFRSLA